MDADTTHTISLDAFHKLIEAAKDSAGDLEIIFDALISFENYHQAIIRECGFHRVFGDGGLDSAEFHDQYHQYDESRTIAHNAAIANLDTLNRLAQLHGLPRLYNGTMSGRHPFRREIGDAIIGLLDEIVAKRS